MAYIYNKLYSGVLSLLLIFGTIAVQAQHLTITTSGQTGTSGTNWSIVGNELLVATSGSASVHPNVITNHLTNTGNLVVRLPWLAGTERNILINNSIQYTGATARTLSFRAGNNIDVAAGVQITSSTAALNLVLHTRMGVLATPDYGRVTLENAPVISTNGGHLWVGGGTTATTTWNGLAVGEGQSITWIAGLSGVPMVGANITTNGGSFYVSGLAFPSATPNTLTSYGVYIDNSTINTGAGSVTVDGSIRGTFFNGSGTMLHGNTGPVSLTTTSGGINITGEGFDNGTAGSWRVAVYLWGQNSAVSVSSQSGNIDLNGNAQFTSTTNDKEGIVLTGTASDRARIISRTGNITLRGSNTREGDGQYCNSIRFTTANASNSIRIGADGTNAYSGNILMEGNSIYQRTNQAGAGSIAVQSTGTLKIQPTGTSFTHMRAGDAGSLTYDDDWNFGSTFSSFTYAKAGNTQDLSLGSALTVAGPITFHANSFTINKDITSSTASDITINANVNFSTSAIRQTITTAGGNIIINADSDASGTGTLDIDYLTLNPGAGNITIRGDLFNWTVNTNTDKPYINGTGSFTFEPGDAAFGQGFQTAWFHIDQDANGISGVTLGKSGNTSNITLDHVGTTSGLTVAGPITAYGGVITVSTPLTSSAAGDIFLKAITGAATSIVNSSTITKSGGTGTLTMQAHARINHSGTITTSGTGVLNAVLWSDFDNSNNDGGVTSSGAISTNGGHVWLGGSNSNGGSYTWNGLTVGDGPSIGTAGYNTNALDLNGNVTTSGGDFLAWAGNGSGGINGIGSNSSGNTINTGSGDIVLMANAIDGTGGTSIIFNGTGKFYLVPNGGNFGATLDWNPVLTGSTFGLNFPGVYNYLIIDNYASLTGLTIGRYNEMLTGSTPVVQTNSSNVTISMATSIAGPIEIYGGAIALNANLTTTNTTTGDMLVSGTSLSGSGNLVLATGRTGTISVSSASTYAGVISGNGSGLTKAGTGVLTLTNDQTYTGTTTISAGDLQVGSGGSVSQGSSGSLVATSPIVIAAGSELILAPNENVTFANNVSGAGAVELKGMSGRYYNAFLTGSPATIVSNSSVLEVLTRIIGGAMGGLNATGDCGAYRKSYNATTNVGTLQFQHYGGGDFTKGVYATVERINSTDVAIRATGAAFKAGNVLGQDMTTVSSTSQTLATTSGGSGYGISQVYMSGKVNFTGTLTYSGATILSNTVTSGTNPTYSYTSRGTQEITDASASFPSGSTVANNGLIIFNRSTALTISNDLSGTEEILQVGAAITLTGTNTYSGATTIDLNKTLNLGTGGTTGSLTGNIVNYGSLTINRSNAFTYAGIISGSGNLTKTGSSDLVLTGLNTYTGSSTINGGRLILERNIPASSSSTFSGSGMLVIQPSSASFTNAVSYPISGFTVSSTIGGLVVGKLGNTANITVTSATTAAGPISFYGGTVTLNENIAPTSNGNISLYANTLSFASGKTVASGGQLLVAPSSVANTIGVAGSTGNLVIPDSYFTTNFADGFSNIIIGSDDQTGNIVTRQVTVRDNMSFRTSGSLTIENSPFDIGTYDLTLGGSMTVLGMPSNYIKTSSSGVVNRSVPTGSSLIFPVGNGSYNPLTVTNNTGAADDFSARVADGVTEAGTSGTAIADKVVNRTWHIGKTNANTGSGVDMTFQWDAAQELGTLADYKLSHYGTFWAQATGTSGTVSVSGTTKTMTHTGYTGTFSPFAVGSSSSALPVSWVDFTAVRAGQAVELNWRTGSEQNTSDYIVQHSIGNGNWSRIGTVVAAGTSNTIRKYSFTHTQPLDGRNLYRLLQRDLDGKESLSKVVSVNMPSATSVQVYPIPSTNGSVFVKLPSDQVLKLFNSNGVLVLEQQGKAGVQLLDLKQLQKGLYYLKVGKETTRVMLQ